jgi:hypothetical protein
MKQTAVLVALMLLTTLGDRAGACDLMSMRGRPDPASARAIGVVMAYSEGLIWTAEAAPPLIGTVEAAPGLIVRIDQVVSGQIVAGDALVAPFFYDPGCRSHPFNREQLEQAYPLGTAVVVRGQSTSQAQAPMPQIILAESNQHGFVAAIPAEVSRTAAGDLDFGRHYRDSTFAYFVAFEFDRAVLALTTAGRAEQLARLRNLAPYRGLSYDVLGELASEGGLTPAERQRLLDYYWEIRAR